METNWLKYAKRLQAIASTGLHFSKDEFDRERYEEIGAIANSMLAELAAVPVERTFICERIGLGKPVAGNEIADVGFFSIYALPPLSQSRVIRSDIETAFWFASSSGATIFD